jgi:hypothetical protein
MGGACYNNGMIIVYAFNGLTPKSRAKLNSLKAQTQPRLRNGRFAKPLPKPAAVENNPLVEFFYPMSDQPWNSKKRLVRLISSTATHFTGLEKTESGWKFKKFLQPKAQQFHVVSFNPKSMS